MRAKLYAPTSREVNSFSARLTSPPKFTISFARSRTMTSLSEVVMKAQPFLLRSSRISSAFAMSPLCARATSPYAALTTSAWACAPTLPRRRPSSRPLRPVVAPKFLQASEAAGGAVLLLFMIRALTAPPAPDVDAPPSHLAERRVPVGHAGHLRHGEM